jgi:hypothetical protein
MISWNKEYSTGKLASVRNHIGRHPTNREEHSRTLANGIFNAQPAERTLLPSCLALEIDGMDSNELYSDCPKDFGVPSNVKNRKFNRNVDDDKNFQRKEIVYSVDDIVIFCPIHFHFSMTMFSPLIV